MESNWNKYWAVVQEFYVFFKLEVVTLNAFNEEIFLLGV